MFAVLFQLFNRNTSCVYVPKCITEGVIQYFVLEESIHIFVYLRTVKILMLLEQFVSLLDSHLVVAIV